MIAPPALRAATWASTSSTSPPIHPIGRPTARARTTRSTPSPDDPGSPYAIGAEEGGHDAVHPAARHARRLPPPGRSRRASTGWRSRSTSPSSARPTIPGSRSIRSGSTGGPTARSSTPRTRRRSTRTSSTSTSTATAVPALWHALRDVVLFWVEQGVQIFRVDNPHTKPLPFWEWMIARSRRAHPDVIFLSEAFTRPKMMKRLAKVGFTQSYTYFTWRNTKQELTEYLTELTHGRAARVLPAELLRQHAGHQSRSSCRPSGRPGFRIRARAGRDPVGIYGIYSGLRAVRGDADPGQRGVSRLREVRDQGAGTGTGPATSSDDIARLNRIRREQSGAAASFRNLRFLQRLERPHPAAYGKSTADRSDIACSSLVNLDPHNRAGARTSRCRSWEFGLPDRCGDRGRGPADAASRFTLAPARRSASRLDPAERPVAIWRLLAPVSIG